MTELPLHDVRVLDLTRVIAGPHCTRMLVELGADVIKLEPPSGDLTRTLASNTTSFAQLNMGKRLIAVDLDHELGRDLVRRLALEVDVLVENFRPGVMAGWNLDYSSLASDNAGLIYVSISGYGQTGEWSGRRAFAAFVHAETGYLSTIAEVGGRRLEHDPMSTADLVTAKDACVALLAALRRRDRTGKGQHVDISLAHSMLFFNEYSAAKLSPGAAPPKSTSAPQAIFTTADGVSFSAGNPVSSEVFEPLCAAFGCAELVSDPRFADSGSRRSHRAELIAALQAALSSRGGADEVQRALAERRIVVGSVQDVASAADSSWASERRATMAATDADGSTVRLPSAPWLFSDRMEGKIGRDVYGIGHDNASVLIDVLGMDEAEVGRLAAMGVVRSSPPQPAIRRALPTHEASS